MLLKACLFLTVINGILPLPTLLYLIYNALDKKSKVSLDGLIVASLGKLGEDYVSFPQLTCTDIINNMPYRDY